MDNYRIGLIVVLLLCLNTHLAFFGYPSEVVFDEVHNGKFISAYATGQYFFDVHPPLAKLLIAGLAHLTKTNTAHPFAAIGDAYPKMDLVILRIIPLLAGLLLPLLIYLLAAELGLSFWPALMAGGFMALDNALIVQSRFILFDEIILVLGFGCLYSSFRYARSGRAGWLVLAGASAGSAVSIKWTGLAFLALAAAHQVYLIITKKQYKRLPVFMAALILLPAAIYTATFVIHFSLLPRSGAGDAFMSREFQHGLIGNALAQDKNLRAPNVREKIFELHRQMWQAHHQLTTPHNYSSAWYSWPFLTRPIYYWNHDNARIYLIGNPFIWWLSTLAVGYAIFSLLIDKHLDKKALWLIAGYGLNFLSFAAITRVLFLYHYLPALVFAILLVAHLVDRSAHRAATVITLLTLALICFLFFAPLTYGLPLSPSAYEHRVWLPTWK